jgi:valyl-tRNA synthetase
MVDKKILKVMQDIVIALEYPLLGVKPLNYTPTKGWEEHYLNNERWLLEHLKEVPYRIKQMKDENRVKYQAELDANRERIKDQLDLEIRTNERLITELNEMSKLQYKKYEEYENEIKKLKEENELLRSGKERVIIIEKRN